MDYCKDYKIADLTKALKRLLDNNYTLKKAVSYSNVIYITQKRSSLGLIIFGSKGSDDITLKLTDNSKECISLISIIGKEAFQKPTLH